MRGLLHKPSYKAISGAHQCGEAKLELFPYNNFYIRVTVDIKVSLMASTITYPSQDYLPNLFKFIFKYGKIGHISRDKNLNAVFGSGFAKKIQTIIGDFDNTFVKKSEVDMAKIDDSKMPLNEVLYCTCSGSKTTSFLQHLRNSLAHGLIGIDHDSFVIRDYNYNRGGKLSAYGKIKAEKVMQIIDLYIK